MRIGEYKQIDVEIVESTIMVDEYDANGNVVGRHEETVTKETPVMGMVYRDMTPEEEAEMQASELEMLTHTMPTTMEEKMQMLVETIQEQKPEGTTVNEDGTLKLPFKVGYRWEKKLVGNTIMYESVEDPNALGTQQNPIIYHEGVQLIDNAWYKFGDILKVYMMGEFEEL